MCYGWEGLGWEMSVIIMEDIGLELSFYMVGHSLLVGDICRRKVIGNLTSPRGFSFSLGKVISSPILEYGAGRYPDHYGFPGHEHGTCHIVDSITHVVLATDGGSCHP